MLKNGVPLKSNININPMKAYKIKNIVENKFSMFIWINYNGISVPVNVCAPECTDCTPIHAIPAGSLTVEKLLDDAKDIMLR